MICLCKNCIAAIRSRGEKVMVGELLSDYDEDDKLRKCEWCEEEGMEMYECAW